jgi:hypothetical protein
MDENIPHGKNRRIGETAIVLWVLVCVLLILFGVAANLQGVLK